MFHVAIGYWQILLKVFLCLEMIHFFILKYVVVMALHILTHVYLQYGNPGNRKYPTGFNVVTKSIIESLEYFKENCALLS